MWWVGAGRAAVFICVLVLCARSYGQDPVHRRYTVADGLPSNTIYCALQDRDGFMWFGTEAGAVRFDGTEFKVLSIEDGLTDTDVIRLAEDSKGRMWFLTLNGKLCYFHKGMVHNGSTDPDLARFQGQSGWHSFVEDVHGMLWFGAVRSDILRLDMSGDADTLWPCDLGEISVLLDEAGEVMSHRGLQLYEHHQDDWIQVDKLDRDFANHVIHQGPLPGSHPIALAMGGIRELRNARWSVLLPGDYLDLTDHEVCWRDAGGDIWIRCRLGGVDLVDTVPPVALRHFFPEEYINYVFLDEEGNHWFCTPHHGVLMVSARQWSTRVFQTLHPGSAEGFRSLLLDHTGHVWVGTDGGNIHRIDSNKLGPDLGDPLLRRIVGLAEGPDHMIYAGTDRAIVRIDPSTGARASIPCSVRLPAHKVNVRDLPAKAISIAQDSTLWVSNFNIWSTALGEHMMFKCPDEPSMEIRIACIHADPHGVVWFSSTTALNSWNKGVVTRYPELDQYMGLGITHLTSWSADTLMVATRGAGVHLVNSGRIVRSFTEADGLPSNDVRKVKAQNDTLLVSTIKGSGVGVPAGNGSMRWIQRTRADGLPADEVNDALLVGHDMWVATSLGLAVLPFEQLAYDPQPPRVHIVSATSGDRSLDIMRPSTLKEGEDRLTIRFAAIVFAEPGQVEYQYRLHGLEPWTRTATTALTFAAMSAGEYQFAVRARKPGSDWSLPVGLSLLVEAAWWNRMPARASMILLGVLGVVAISRSRLQRQHRKVVAEWRARQVVNEERSRIAADIHDDLGADLSRLLHYARRAEPSTAAAAERPLTVGLDRAIDKMDEIIWALDPKRDTLQSTVQFIEQQAREAAENHGLEFRAHVQLPRSPVHLAAGHRRELMLLCREAIRNIVDHAGADTMWVEWRAEEDVVHVAIHDDGRGLDPAFMDPARHGLHNMRERAAHLGGTLQVERGDPTGTSIRLHFPLSGITRSDDAADDERDHIAP